MIIRHASFMRLDNGLVMVQPQIHAWSGRHDQVHIIFAHECGLDGT